MLEDDEHLVPEFLGHQRKAKELLVFVAVADDEVVRPVGDPEHRLQFGLAAALEPEPERSPELDNLLDHVPLLIDLDRVDRIVFAGIAELLDGPPELGGQQLDPGPENIGKTDYQGRVDVAATEGAHELV